jgi:hypothetical protein
MKTATYRGLDGKERIVEYDPEAPCISCGLSVVSASMAGTRVCPWCDCGMYRDGTHWSIEAAVDTDLRKARAKEIQVRSGC